MRCLDLNSLFIRQFLDESLGGGGPKGNCLLDLGCGTKPHESIYRETHHHYVAADFDIRSKIDVRLRAETLPFSESSFDTIIFTEVIEHLQHPADAIAEIARVLKPAGRLLLTWPFIYPLHELPHDYVRFTEFAISKLLDRHGLAIESLRRRGDMFSVLVTVVGDFLTGFGMLVTRTPLLGPFLRIISWCCTGINNVLVLATYKTTRTASRLRPDGPGQRLLGKDRLAHWTLGYCVVARKVRSV